MGRPKAKDISRRDVVTLLNAIVDRNAPIQANRTLTILRRMFRFAVGQAILDISPCDQVERPSAENERNRALGEDEIRLLWRALETASMEPNARRILRLMLVTGQRKGEVMGLHVQEVDFDNLFDARPASKRPRRRIAGDPKVKAPPLAGIMGRFTPHDLRRTVATRMRELGISRGDVKMILNHVETDVTARYDRYDGLAEKRRALDLWAKHLMQIIDGEAPAENVVELARRLITCPPPGRLGSGVSGSSPNNTPPININIK